MLAGPDDNAKSRDLPNLSPAPLTVPRSPFEKRQDVPFSFSPDPLFHAAMQDEFSTIFPLQRGRVHDASGTGAPFFAAALAGFAGPSGV
tara:strand:- start:899 stop:1165 length:267 start_codon:yes stop_codon:yes gene_type:complete